MAIYEVRDYYSGDLLGTVDLDLTSPSGGPHSADELTIPALLLYIIGFFGMGIMLFNLPTYMIFVGIVALLIYVSPLIMVAFALLFRSRAAEHELGDGVFDAELEPITAVLANLLTGGGGLLRSVLKNFIAPFAYVLFNLFLGIFWPAYALGSVEGDMLLAFIIPCAYSMYYYPYVLICNAVKRKSPLLGILAGVIILGSLAAFLLTYDTLMAQSDVLGIALLFTSLTVLGTLTILICNLCYSKTKRGRIRHAVTLGIYFVLVVAILLSVTVFIPGNKQEEYDSAMALIAEGKYAEARDVLDDILGYGDSRAQYEAILFKELTVGETVYYGTHAFYGGTYGNPARVENDPVAWIVLEVNAESGKALLFARDVLELRSFGKDTWETTEIREFLNGGTFEKEIMGTEVADKVLTTAVSSVTGEGTVTTEDRFFLISRTEYERYVADAALTEAMQGVSYTDRSYSWITHEFEYDEQGWADAVKKYSYYLRDVAEDGESILAVQNDGTLFSIDDGGRFFNKSGIRPACWVALSE